MILFLCLFFALYFVFFALFCIVFCIFSFCAVSFLFLHKFTDHCHRVETQLQSINVYHNKSKPILILCNFIGSSHGVGARLVCCLALIFEYTSPPQ
jgi:hypothetical protein